jgi:hypothetical protein
MKLRHIVISLIFVLGIGAAYPSHAQFKSTENGLEANFEMLTLPTSVDGVLAMRGATAKSAKILRVTRETKYIVDDVEVTLAEFTAYARGNGDASVVVMHIKGGDVVTRIKARSSSPPAR